MSTTTETMDTAFVGLDTWPDAKILEALAAGQERAIAAVRKALPDIARAAEAIAAKLKRGGRLAYAGAGTSIRVAVQDGSELPATFGFPPERLVYLIAGGKDAMFETMADAEDDAEAGAEAAQGLSKGDSLIAVAASGATPYTVAAVQTARKLGALTVAISNNAATPLGAAAEIEIVLLSAPEVISGSTRMGAGTAQKAALNLLSTLVNIKLGAVHDGLMVNVRAENAKLKRRAARIVMRISGADDAKAMAALETTAGDVKTAILICSGVASRAEAQVVLAATDGNLRRALETLPRRV
jgi:N-acetylmuramic acid 6-phosphate etherase